MAMMHHSRRTTVSWLVGAVVLAVAGCAGGETIGVFNGDGEIPTVRGETGTEWLMDRVLWSPDGTRLAVMGWDTGPQPTVALAEGGQLRSLTTPDWAALDAAWLPDSGALVVSYVPEPYGTLEPRWSRLDVVDVTGDVVDSITPVERLRFETGMAVAADGSAVVASAMEIGAYATDADLARIAVDSGSVEWLTDTPGVFEGYPVLLEDGRIVFIEWVEGRAPGRVAVLDPESGDRTLLTPADLSVSAISVRADGDVVVFSAYPEGPSGRFGRGIYTVGLDGGDPVRILDVEATPVALHPLNPLVAAIEAGTPGNLGGVARFELAGTGG